MEEVTITLPHDVAEALLRALEIAYDEVPEPKEPPLDLARARLKDALGT